MMTAPLPNSSPGDYRDDLNCRTQALHLAFRNRECGFEAFVESLVRVTTKPLTDYIIAGLGVRGREDQEDLFQDVFVRFMEAEPNYRLATPHLRWLNRVAYNRWIDVYRMRARWKDVNYSDGFHDNELPTRVDGVWQQPHLLYLPNYAHSLSGPVLLARELERIPKQLRPTAYLFFIEGYTQPEIANDLSLKQSKVNFYVAEARRHLLPLLRRDKTQTESENGNAGR